MRGLRSEGLHGRQDGRMGRNGVWVETAYGRMGVWVETAYGRMGVWVEIIK